jgi:hypothetical protein
MRPLDPISRLFVLSASVALAAGCNLATDPQNAAPASSNAWEQQSNFTDPLGGYTFTSEKVAFGDPALQQMEAIDAPQTAGADSMPNDSTGTAFLVRVEWGQLEGNPNATSTLDWTGSIGVDQGAFQVLRAIGFEPGQGDHLVLPRPNRQTLAFVSHTSMRLDGLLLAVRPNAPAGGTGVAAEGSLTFATPPLTRSFTYTELRTANLVIPVDTEGNAVSIVGMSARPNPTECTRGFVRGEWMHRSASESDSTVDRGLFRGLWVTDFGRPMGTIRGHFGTNASGEQVWFGKIIGRRGEPLAIARGTYAANPDSTQAGGTFTGDILTGADVVSGHVEGHFVPGRLELVDSPNHDPRPADPAGGDARRGRPGSHGFIDGRWSLHCTDPVGAQ